MIAMLGLWQLMGLLPTGLLIGYTKDQRPKNKVSIGSNEMIEANRG